MLNSTHDDGSAPARRIALARIIRTEAVGRQSELVKLLRKQGHEATQSSISRDLRELGVAKLGDRYVLPDPASSVKDDFASLKQFVRGRNAIDEIAELVDLRHVSLLVIGLRRRSPVGKLLLGSMAQEILLTISCPILAVKAD